MSVPDDDLHDPEGVFRQYAADTRIQFCLATTTTDGNPTSGVNYRKVLLPSSVEDLVIKSNEQGAAAWDPSRYLNIWIVSQPDSIAGYAQRPGLQPVTDGIVIDPRFFGLGGTSIAPFNGGKTLTHLIGTYLGLAELWTVEGCGDDGIEDTPVHNAPNFGIPGTGHISTCDGYPIEMVMNFMDNTDDVVQYMFTLGQARSMRSVLLPGGLRSQLTNTATQCNFGETSLTAFSNLSQPPSLSSSVVATTSGESSSLIVWPNPANSYADITIQSTVDGPIPVLVRDIKGSTINSSTVISEGGVARLHTTTLDWASGMYTVQANVNGKVITERLIVQR